jgi:hypothetical protein
MALDRSQQTWPDSEVINLGGDEEMKKHNPKTMREDTRTTHGITCYCESCCATAEDWYEWRSPDGIHASGPRYWTVEDALMDEELARADGLTVLHHQT